MKKILIFSLVVFFFTSCGTNNQNIEQAKKELLGKGTTPQNENSVETQKEESPSTEKSEDQKEEDLNTSQIQKIALSEKQFLDFNDISLSGLKSGEIEISGNANTNVEKIEVLFKNPTSDFPDDNYTLQTYKPEEGTFIYRASSKNQVLDYGENSYIFTAHSGNETSQTKVIIHFEKQEEKTENTGVEKDILGTQDNTLQISFPTSSKYGEPIKLGESSFTYSGIKGFEAKKEVFTAPTCEGLTEFLTEKMTTWYYWNTCRDIVKDYGIKFNVLRLDGEKYVYERHYIDAKHGIYATYELETGTGISKDNIAEKNNEFKVREFPSLDVVDDLMKDIVKS